MEILKNEDMFIVDLNNISMQIGIKTSILIQGIVPDTYGQIMNDLEPPLNDTRLISFSVNEFIEIMETQIEVFKKNIDLKNKTLFFLRECKVDNKCYWVEILEWSEKTYSLSERKNTNNFNNTWNKRLMDQCLFLTVDSIIKIETENNKDYDSDIDDWAEREAHSISSGSMRERF